MIFIIILLIQLIKFCSNEQEQPCYFHVFHTNGSQSWCLDEECYQHHFDLISIEDIHCRTNYLSLRFSSYSTYLTFLQKSSLNKLLSSYFSPNRSNLERLLQIEFISPLENDHIFQLDQLKLLTNSFPSNIDTYELSFHGNLLIENPLQFNFDEQIFLSEKQQYIDTLRLIFNCTDNQRVEWELVKSIQSIPNSPCTQQIQLKQNDNQDQLYIIIIASCIEYLSIIIILVVGLILFYNFSFNNDQIYQQRLISDSSISLIKRF